MLLNFYFSKLIEKNKKDFVLKIKKEVIHPQVPLRIPCDNLTHLTDLKFGTTK